MSSTPPSSPRPASGPRAGSGSTVASGTAGAPSAAPEPAYPHDLHPGLVPGISVDEQRHRFGMDWVIFSVTALAIVGFVAWGLLDAASVSVVAGEMFSWAMVNMGWLLNLTVLVGLIVMVVIAFSRFGQIRLGKDDEAPEFSRFAWVAMMFGAGIGVGIFFFGPSEPLAYFLSPPPHTEAASQAALNGILAAEGTDTGPNREAIHQAMAQSHFHWGLTPWALYAMVGGAIAYSSYRRGRVTLLSSTFRSLFGARTEGFAGRIVDVFAIVATLFGTATTLGLSAIQIGEGISIVSGLDEVGNNVLIVIIAVLTVAFIVSAVSGVSRGIRYLSNINISLTLGLVLFAFFAGPTLFLTNLLPSGVMQYASEFFAMAGKSLSWGPETVQFQSLWTAFYWAWWIAWTPFVGMFIARISRGRTLREFSLVTMAVPTAILILAFTVFGGSAILRAIDGQPGFDAEATPEQVLFHLFGSLPLGEVTPFLLIAVLAIFFVTSADSASVVMGTMSSKGNPAPPKLVVVFWGLCMMGLAVVMLLTGGEDALSGFQSIIILISLPFCLILLLMMVAFLKDLSTDPAAIRRDYAQAAVRNAVRRGIEAHGDDFELAVQPSPAGQGAGADFDSTAEHVTEWYRRTDEDGNEVGYDYQTNTWADGWTPEGEEEAEGDAEVTSSGQDLPDDGRPASRG